MASCLAGPQVHFSTIGDPGCVEDFVDLGEIWRLVWSEPPQVGLGAGSHLPSSQGSLDLSGIRLRRLFSAIRDPGCV